MNFPSVLLKLETSFKCKSPQFGVDVERILQMIDQMKVEEEARLKQLIDEDNKMLIK